MPPQKRAGLGEALDAARVTGPQLREALDLATGAAPEADPAAGDFSWAASRPARRFGRVLIRRDNWLLAAAVVGAAATVAGVIIALLTLVKPSG